MVRTPHPSTVTYPTVTVPIRKGDGCPGRPYGWVSVSHHCVSLFRGLSGNKMIDSINTERYTILHKKSIRLTLHLGKNVTHRLSSGPSGRNFFFWNPMFFRVQGLEEKEPLVPRQDSERVQGSNMEWRRGKTSLPHKSRCCT